MTAQEAETRVPHVIERLVRKLVVATRAVSFYPPTSAIPGEAADVVVAALGDALFQAAEIHFVVTKDGLFFDQQPVLPGQPAFVSFARELYNRNLSGFHLRVGTDAQDIISFLTVASEPSDELLANGGFASRLRAQNVSTISVTETKVILVDADAPAGSDADLHYTAEEIDELIASARRGVSRDQLTIARFIGSPKAVRNYLYEIMASGVAGLDGVAESLSRLAQIAANSSGDERNEFMRSLAETVLGLAEDLRRELVAERLLPQARQSEPIAAIVRQMDIEEVCRMLLSGDLTSGGFRTGISRAIRNLSAITGADKRQIAGAMRTALEEQGLAEAEIDSFIEQASPDRLSVAEQSASTVARPTDAVIALIDQAPVAESGNDTPELLALRDEALRGVTEADVVMALVTIVTLDAREEQFNTAMGHLEGAVGVLIVRGELEVAADVTAALGTAAQGADVAPEQRDRLVRAISRFARPDDIKRIADAMRTNALGSAEHRSALRLVRMLGPLVIKPLLDQLADEQDMSVRKGLVDTISEIAPSHVAALGAQLSDQRWFFVRNVVGILGSTRLPAALAHLERTLRHPEPRVRRETIRALSLITDRHAAEMLVHALNDRDAQNVQLAARYIAKKNLANAVPMLEQVVRGEGIGNRENPARIEAIETLGKLGATQALPTLQMLAGRRAVMGGAKARELRSAAIAAIARISAKGGAA